MSRTGTAAAEKAVCDVCPHRCRLEVGQKGRCGARKNRDGRIVCDNYGRVTALALDPIEKKPLHRFYPGSQILSVGSYGCNMHCAFCQNHDISMAGEQDVRWVYVSPEMLAEKAESLREQGNIGVAFTYNEPSIGFEYVADTAKLLHETDMKTVLVTNGCVTGQPAETLCEYMDAMNIDLKGFTEEFYRRHGGDLETVKRFIQKAADHCHVELTTLIVPGENDGEQELRDLVSWIADIDPAIPLHVSRFFPRWKMTEGHPTPVEQIYDIAAMAREKLKYVYTGNC